MLTQWNPYHVACLKTLDWQTDKVVNQLDFLADYRKYCILSRIGWLQQLQVVTSANSEKAVSYTECLVTGKCIVEFNGCKVVQNIHNKKKRLMSPSRPGYSEPHTTWPCTLPGMGHPHLLWTFYSSVSLSSFHHPPHSFIKEFMSNNELNLLFWFKTISSCPVTTGPCK